MIETAAMLTDEIIDLNDRSRRQVRASAERGKATNDKVRLYPKVGAALIVVREQSRDPFAAIRVTQYSVPKVMRLTDLQMPGLGGNHVLVLQKHSQTAYSVDGVVSQCRCWL